MSGQKLSAKDSDNQYNGPLVDSWDRRYQNNYAFIKN